MSTGGLSMARLARMHDVMVGHVERGDVPGIVTLVSRRDEVHVDVIGMKAIGGSEPMRRDTIFRIASVTKPITAAAAMILVEECALRLDEPVDPWLPELADCRVLRAIDSPLDDTHVFSAVREGLEAMTEALTPGRPIGEVDDAHRRVLDAAGLEKHRMAACGYSLGTTFQPNWMDWPMLFSGNSVLAEPGNVFFLHCIVVDSDRGVAMSLGRTCLVTETDREVFSRQPLELTVV